MFESSHSYALHHVCLHVLMIMIISTILLSSVLHCLIACSAAIIDFDSWNACYKDIWIELSRSRVKTRPRGSYGRRMCTGVIWHEKKRASILASRTGTCMTGLGIIFCIWEKLGEWSCPCCLRSESQSKCWWTLSCARTKREMLWVPGRIISLVVGNWR